MKLEGEQGRDGDQQCFNKAHAAGRARRTKSRNPAGQWPGGERSGGITKRGKGRCTAMKERKRREKM